MNEYKIFYHVIYTAVFLVMLMFFWSLIRDLLYSINYHRKSHREGAIHGTKEHAVEPTTQLLNEWQQWKKVARQHLPKLKLYIASGRGGEKGVGHKAQP